MDARQRLGAVLVVAGVALALVGVAGSIGYLGSPAASTASPTPAGSSGPSNEPAMTVVPPTIAATLVPPTPAPTEDTLAIVRAFFVELETAVHTGTQETMTDRLGQAVFDRYGRETCSANLAAKEPVAEQAFEILSVSGPAPWDYVTAELTTTVPDALTVGARVAAPDASGGVTTVERELHVQVSDGVVYWFTDCGEPLG